MEPTTRKYLQVGIVVALALALLRTGYIFYQRSQADRPKEEAPARQLQGDDFVFIRSLHAYDLASAKKLEGMTVWIKAGNAIAYFKPGDVQHEAGTLPPLARLKISKVAPSGNQVFATFTFEDGGPAGTFQAPVGAVKRNDVSLILDELFYYDDPHQLYKHWPKETWEAIGRHEIVKGMSETQAGMAMGVGRTVGSTAAEYGNRTLQYQHEGKTVEVLFMGNQAARIEKKE